MAWKEYAEEVANELKAAQDAISRLRRQLAEREEQLAISNNGGRQTSHTPIQSQVTELENQLLEARNDKDRVARESAEFRELFQNTLAKLSKVEKEDHAEIEKLKNRLAGKNEQLRNMQATRATDLAMTDREKQLNTKIEQLQATVKRLNQQLQVEKSENTSRITSMRSDPRKRPRDEDDEEDLPNVTPSRQTSMTPSMSNTTPSRQASVTPSMSSVSSSVFRRALSIPSPQFKMPPAIPDYWSKPNGYSDKIDDKGTMLPPKAPEPAAEGPGNKPKRHKRSAHDEVRDKLSKLELGKTGLSSASRSTKVMSKGVISDVDMDDDLPDTKSFIRLRASVSKKQDTAIPPNLDESFSFAAICKYKRSGVIDSWFPSEDLAAMIFLWERIEKTRFIWDKNSHNSWFATISEGVNDPAKPPCITMKLSKKRTNWHKGSEGKYACRDCAKMGRPCFVWIPDGTTEDGLWHKGELRLLPLHDKDRVLEVEKNVTEVRYWLNDETDFQDSDVLKVDKDDDEYME